MQQTFLSASLDLAQLREPAGFRGWAAGICVHAVHRRLSARQRWRRLVDAISLLVRPSSEPSELDEARALYRVLDQLSADLRVPWVLHTIEGETLPEVARMCGVSLATIKRRVASADALINRRLDGH